MSFRRHTNRHDYWLETCARHADLLSSIPDAVVRNEGRFRALLTVGEVVDEGNDIVVRLRDLDDAEIERLVSFVYYKAQFDMDTIRFDAFNDEFRRRRSR
jgi:hypothetical protein